MAVPVYDNATTDTDTVGRTSGSFSHTCTGSNLGLVAILQVVDGESPAPTVSSCTYNSVNLTEAITETLNYSSTRYLFTSIWYLAAPATGSNTFAFTYSEEVLADAVTVISYTGTHQTTPLGATASGSEETNIADPSVNITTANADSIIVAGAAMKGGDTNPWTPGTSITERADGATGGNANTDIGYTAGEKDAASATTYTMDFDATGSGAEDNWTIAAMELRSPAATPSGITSLRQLIGHGQGTR